MALAKYHFSFDKNRKNIPDQIGQVGIAKRIQVKLREIFVASTELCGRETGKAGRGVFTSKNSHRFNVSHELYLQKYLKHSRVYYWVTERYYLQLL